MEKEIKDRIQITAKDLFMRVGIRSVTMDDIARELSISKKTLYQYFDNKDQLVNEIVRSHLEEEKVEFSEIEANAENAIHELIGIAQCIRAHISNLNPSTLYDVQKYHAEAWNHFKEFKQNGIKGHVKRNIKRGIEEGYYRQEIDAEILATYRIEQVEMIFDPRIFPANKFDLKIVQIQLFEHFVHGMLTSKGKELYEEFQNENKVLANE